MSFLMLWACISCGAIGYLFGLSWGRRRNDPPAPPNKMTDEDLKLVRFLRWPSINEHEAGSFVGWIDFRLMRRSAKDRKEVHDLAKALGYEWRQEHASAGWKKISKAKP